MNELDCAVYKIVTKETEKGLATGITTIKSTLQFKNSSEIEESIHRLVGCGLLQRITTWHPIIFYTVELDPKGIVSSRKKYEPNRQAHI